MDAPLFTEYYMAISPEAEEHAYYERGGPLFLTLMSPGRYYMNGDVFYGTIREGRGRMHVDPNFTMEKLYRRLEWYGLREGWPCIIQNQLTHEGASGPSEVMRMLCRYVSEHQRRQSEEGPFDYLYRSNRFSF